jgi:ADP-heptose:LPS heptosyltransferase
MSDADFGLIGTVEDRKHYNRLWSLVGDASDKLYDCTGQSLDFVALYLRTVDCLVCVNSGIMHIAVLVGCPVVAIVGGTPARIILPPDNPKVKWIEDPELKWWDEHAEHGPRASRLNEIMPQQVYAKILELE